MVSLLVEISVRVRNNEYTLSGDSKGSFQVLEPMSDEAIEAAKWVVENALLVAGAEFTEQVLEKVHADKPKDDKPEVKK